MCITKLRIYLSCSKRRVKWKVEVLSHIILSLEPIVQCGVPSGTAFMTG